MAERRRAAALVALAHACARAARVAPPVPPAVLNCTRGLVMAPSELDGARGGAAAVRAAGPRGGTLVYVPFGKAGSSSMRAVLHAAAPGAFRRFLYMHGGCVAAPQLRPDGSERRRPFALGAQVLLQGPMGACRVLWNARGAPRRACAYFTLLREPVARALSAYAYFCLACAEGGRMCAREAAAGQRALLGGRTCPHGVSLPEFTRLFGRPYVEELSGATGCAPCAARAANASAPADGARWVAELSRWGARPYRAQCGPLPARLRGAEADARMLAAARRAVEHAVLPLVLEEGLAEGARLLGAAFGWAPLGGRAPPHRNRLADAAARAGASERVARIPSADLDAVREYLRPDIELYRHARARYRQLRDRLLPPGVGAGRRVSAAGLQPVPNRPAGGS